MQSCDRLDSASSWCAPVFGCGRWRSAVARPARPAAGKRRPSDRRTSVALLLDQRRAQGLRHELRRRDRRRRKYEIKVPAKWNGTLLLYSHGYRFAQPGPPDFGPVSTTRPGRLDRRRRRPARDPLAKDAAGARGYALAGSSYRTNGWAVADGVEAGDELHAKFVSLVGAPQPHLRLGRLARRPDHRDPGREAPRVGRRRGADVRRAGRAEPQLRRSPSTWPTRSRH